MELRIGINMGDVVIEGDKSLAKEYYDKQKSIKGRIKKVYRNQGFLNS